MLPRTAALAMGCALLTGCQSSPTDEREQASSCPAIEIVGIRGQGQSLDAHRGLGAEVDGIATALADDLASTGTVRTTAIRHASGLGSWDEYVEDVAEGRELLGERLRSIATECPDTRVAVIGFSQGSQIAREELAAEPELARDVDALVLVGSPLRDPASPFRHVELPGGLPPDAGRLGPGPDLGDLSDRTVEACVTGDTVCASDGSSDLAVHRKAYEKPAVARAIADAAADVLG